MNRTLNLAPVLLTLFLAACSGVMDSAKPSKQYYLLSPLDGGGAAAPDGAPSLVLSVSAVPGLDTERVSATSADPAAAIDSARDVARLKAAMGELSGEHREIVNLRHFQDLSYAEIAEVLGVAEGTVMSRLYRARKALARAMRAQEPA